MTSGIVSFMTKPINGKLEGVFLNSNNQISLKVTIGNSDISVFEIQSIQGEQFIPMRLGVVDFKGESFTNVADKWTLNDGLRFEVKGPINSQVTFSVRYC